MIDQQDTVIFYQVIGGHKASMMCLVVIKEYINLL
jgi:hypothetical protein